MLMNRKWVVFMLFGMMLLLFTACSEETGTGENNPEQQEKEVVVDQKQKDPVEPKAQPDEPEPIELVIHQTGGADEEKFMKKYGNYVIEKFPHITIKYIAEQDEIRLPELVLGGQDIDIVISSVGNLPSTFLASGLQYDITDLIKKHNVDLEKFEDAPMDLMEQIAGGEIYGLPDGIANLALLYNKRLFDRFGEDYPRDGMTWDETYELAKTMTRSDAGVDYRGFVLTVNHLVLTNQLSPNLVDPDTNKVSFDTDERWIKFAQNLNRFFQIPGNTLDKDTIKTPYHVAAFEKDQTAAMFSTVRIPAATLDLDWDVAKYPTYPELPGVGPQVYTGYILLASTSKHKEEAFEVINFLSTDEDYRMAITKAGVSQPSLKDPIYQENYGVDDPRLQGKNIAGFFPESNAPSAALTPYETVAREAYVSYLNKYILGEMDLNTALSNATEEANTKIAAEMK